MMLTPDEKALARHALGLPNDTRRSYRNRYAAPRNSENCAAWETMRAKGAADVFAYSEFLKHFELTKDGAEAALEDGESLDLEDFR